MVEMKKIRVKKSICFYILFSLFAVQLFAQESSWLLSASAFEGDAQLATVIPQLLLNHIPSNLERTLEPIEIYEREKFQLLNSRKQLQDSMKNAIESRDKVFFDSSMEWQKEQDRKKYDKQIEEYKNEIENNINEYENLEIKNEIIKEKIKLYNEDTSILFTSNNPVGQIQGLITGSVKRQGSFLYVKVTLTCFPGSLELGSFSTIGEVSEIDSIVQDILSQMLQTLVNNNSVLLNISLNTYETIENATIRIDEHVYKNSIEKLPIQAGIHSIAVDAPGYKSQTFSYNFNLDEEYFVTINLKEIQNINIVLYSENKTGNVDSSIYIAGKPFGNSPASAIVNGLPVLGEVVTSNSVSTYFFLKTPKNFFDNEDATYVASLKPNAVSATDTIEKARKRMYTSYGLLLASLPYAFYSYGRVQDAINAYDYGISQEATYEEYKKWQLHGKISLGVSVTLGVNMVVQLVRYVQAANKVLPTVITPKEVGEE